MKNKENKQQILNFGSIDPLQSKQWYDDNTYYQILLVTPREHKNKNYCSPITTTIVTKTRRKLKEYELDEKTINNSKPYYLPHTCIDDNPQNKLGSYLPTPGAVFSEGFTKTLLGEKNKINIPENYDELSSLVHNFSTEISNFYEPIRTLLQTRKMSQLIASTWYAYSKVQKREQAYTENKWDYFVNGEWNHIDSDILDGLISREIFLLSQHSSPDDFEPKNFDIYYPLDEKTRFLILPSSQAWSGIILSLLLSGQAYYPVDENGNIAIEPSQIKYYHQISLPIFSTGEIVMKYGLEVAWDKYEGFIKEVGINPKNNSIIHQAVIPYPPIPAQNNLSVKDMKKWAKDDDEDGEFPFYQKDEKGNYLINVLYSAPPFPYIPLTCC